MFGTLALLSWLVHRPAGCVDSKLGRDISAHLLSFFKELQRGTGEEGDHTEGRVRERRIHPIFRL